MMRARTTDHDLILLKRPFSVVPSEPRSSFPSHLHLKGHERSRMKPDKTKEPDERLKKQLLQDSYLPYLVLKLAQSLKRHYWEISFTPMSECTGKEPVA